MDRETTFLQRCSLALQISQRKTRIAVREALQPNQLLSVSSAVITVFSIGAAEAWLLTSRSPRPRGAWKFYVKYGSLQILPSIIWLTKPAEVVVRSMGQNPATYLRKFNLNNLADARASLRVTTFQNLRFVAIFLFFAFLSVVKALLLLGLLALHRYFVCVTQQLMRTPNF